MRILLKISGESLKKDNNIDKSMLDRILSLVKERSSDEIILVVGGGNFYRGRDGLDINRVVSDNIGMLSTMMNGMAISSYFNENGVSTSLYGAFEIPGMVRKENVFSVIEDLRCGKVVVFGGGLGVPFLSTDMTAVNKAISYEADVIMMAKNVSYVYNKDPKVGDAKEYRVLTHLELFDLAVKQGVSSLLVLDIEALSCLVKHKIPMYIYNCSDVTSLDDVFSGNVGTKVVS